MIPRLIRTVQTLAVVLLAYVAYANLVAPLIEPDIEFAQAEWAPNPRTHIFQTDFSLFPEGAWERGQPKVLETNQGTLLFDDYHQLENGDLRLPRCTLISYIDPPSKSIAPASPDAESNGQADATPEKAVTPMARRPVVLRASEGAVLSFDPPPDFLAGKLGRLVGGQLQGDVTIFSPASRAAGDDELLIKTKNVQIDQNRIWAPSQVDFRFGRNEAQGRDLSIYLSPPPRGGRRQTAMGGIRSLELVHVDRVNLQLQGDVFAAATGQDPATGRSEASPRQAEAAGNVPPVRSATPIEIKCEGPFRIDFEALIASLEERVDVIRHNLDGPSDQLNCELLEIHLMPKAADPSPEPADVDVPLGSARPTTSPATTSRPSTSRPSAMQPKKIIAVGFPVIVRAPSMRAGARAKRIEYDFITSRVALNDEENATIYNDQFLVAAPQLEYELLEGGRIGRLQAAGPGVARGQMGKERRPFEATWAGSVSLLPQGKNKVLSLLGQADLKLTGIASLKADELHLYLLEVARPGSDQVDIRADRMRANGHIQLDSPQMIAFLSEAQIWFREPTHTETRAARDGSPVTSNSGLFGQASGEGTRRPTKVQLAAGVLRGQVVLTETPHLESLDLQHNVRVNEFQPVAQSKLDIAAQRVVLQHGNAPTAELTLTGAPARFSAEGLTLDGGLIRVQLASNVAEVEGPGTMLMLPQHVALTEDGQAKPLHVDWKQGMRFDGQTARFEGHIETRGSHVTKQRDTTEFMASGDILEVALSRPIQFAAPGSAKVDVSRLSFPGMARVDSRTVDPTGAVTAIDSMIVRDLVIERETGRIEGQGPGQIVHRGPNPQKKQRASNSQPPTAGLIFLRVDFDDQMVGNLNHRELEFLNGTRTILGPIADWEQALDPQRPELLGANSVVLISQRLAVADMREVAGNENAIEVEATGNAHIRGRQFKATGNRVAYIHEKDQLVLEGYGRAAATLEFQQQEGGRWQPLRAKRILFYPQTRQFALDEFELELNDLEFSRRASNAPSVNVPAQNYLPQQNAPSPYNPVGARNRPATPPQAYRPQPARSPY